MTTPKKVAEKMWNALLGLMVAVAAAINLPL